MANARSKSTAPKRLVVAMLSLRHPLPAAVVCPCCRPPLCRWIVQEAESAGGTVRGFFYAARELSFGAFCAHSKDSFSQARYSAAVIMPWAS